MDIERSPVEVLGDIIDEVEGLKRTDARSWLPPRLIALARAAVAFGAASVKANGTSMGDLTELVGRTVAHVFESGDLRRDYDAVLLCSDGGFLVLNADDDSDGAYITAGAHGDLTEIVRHEALQHAGLMSRKDAEEMRRKETEKRIADARRQVERAESALRRAEEDLAKLVPAEAAVAHG
jgi:hypothetical protein